MIDVIGGVYTEYCAIPVWDKLYGSAGRAAAVLAEFTDKVKLHCYVDQKQEADLKFQCLSGTHKIELEAYLVDEGISFSYLHPLSTPQIRRNDQEKRQINVISDIALVFGMLEGNPIVNANRVVYDPQATAVKPKAFKENGSKAKELAIVLNEGELLHLSNSDNLDNAISKAFEIDKPEIIVVKRGPLGAQIYDITGLQGAVPAYKTNKVWKIGSGDVFAALFTYFWGVKGYEPLQSAELASKGTAIYCDSRDLKVGSEQEISDRQYEPIPTPSGKIYIASPFFDLGQRWLVEETRNCLYAAGIDVFSPFHDVGPGPAAKVSMKDLDGLDECQVVLAILNGKDVGTIFEIGYAVAKNIPVIVFAENIPEEDLKMISGTNNFVTNDFSTAIYQAVWASSNA